MPSQIATLNPNGKINRRSLTTDIEDTEVLSRENLSVIGSKKNFTIKKVPGSNRFNSSSVGNYPITWQHRYYNSTPVARSFFFSNGILYYTDENGNVTTLLPVFDPNAYPVSVEMRVTSNDVLYFSDGVNGMYSYDGNNANLFVEESTVDLNFVGMIGWLDRLWGFEENSENLYFSKNLDPINFTDSTDAGVIVIGAKRGSKIQAIALLNETMYIFKTDSIWEISGRTPSEFVVSEIVTNLGCAARRSVVKVESALVFYASDYELHEFNGTQQTKLLTYDVALFGDLTKELNPIVNTFRLDQICAIYHNFLYRMAFCYMDSSAVQNDGEYCFSTVNQIDFFTRGNKIASYCVWDRQPDQKQLVTGRSDIGYLMKQYNGLNWDNQATNPTMSIKTQTKFVGLEEPRNIRVKKVWGNFGVLGAQNIGIRMFIDARQATSTSTSDELVTRGETTAFMAMTLANQSAITSRQVTRHGNSKCLNFSLLIQEEINNRDFEFTSFYAEFVSKNLKRSQKVGI